MLADVVMVWRRLVSHVEGVVSRRRRVGMTVRPLAPSPAVVLCERCRGLGNGEGSELFAHAHATCGAGPGRGLCESVSDSHEQ